MVTVALGIIALALLPVAAVVAAALIPLLLAGAAVIVVCGIGIVLLIAAIAFADQDPDQFKTVLVICFAVALSVWVVKMCAKTLAARPRLSQVISVVVGYIAVLSILVPLLCFGLAAAWKIGANGFGSASRVLWAVAALTGDAAILYLVVLAIYNLSINARNALRVSPSGHLSSLRGDPGTLRLKGPSSISASKLSE